MKTKNKIIISISVFIIVIISLLIILNNNTKTFKVDGVTYAVTLDGTDVSSIPAKGAYTSDVTCTNATGKWLYDEWKLKVTDITGNAACTIAFTTIGTKDYLNIKVTSLADKTIGSGQVVSENGYRYE